MDEIKEPIAYNLSGFWIDFENAIGEGSYGRVLRAVHKETKKLYAVKIFR